MNIAILGAAYTGFAACRHFKKLGHHITVTTTKESRRNELQSVSDKVIVMYGSDEEKMKRATAEPRCSNPDCSWRHDRTRR